MDSCALRVCPPHNLTDRTYNEIYKYHVDIGALVVETGVLLETELGVDELVGATIGPDSVVDTRAAELADASLQVRCNRRINKWKILA